MDSSKRPRGPPAQIASSKRPFPARGGVGSGIPASRRDEEEGEAMAVLGTEEEEEEVEEAMAIGGDAGGADMDEDEAMMIMMAEDETDLIRRAEQAAKEEARRVGQMGRLQPLLAKWRRQPVADFDPRATDIVFQQLDIDYYLTSDSPFKAHYKSSAVLRIFGVNERGNSVCAMVHGFLPYFYVMAPSQFTYDDVAAFHTQLSV
ncbi:unnamed protein product [Closterium sp. NIES-54]